MSSVLIVDSDPIALEILQRAFHARGSVTCIALDAVAAAERIDVECRGCDGMITNIDLEGPKSGWEVARIAREVNPEIAIGYLSAAGHRDWVAYGVPNSLLINTAIDPTEIATTFLRFCDTARRASDHLGRATETVALFGPAASEPEETETLAANAFFEVDWAATPLGAAETWDGNLRSWVRFMLAISEPLLMLWGEDRVTLFNEPFRAAFGEHCGYALGDRFAAPDVENWEQCAGLLERALNGRSGGLTTVHLAAQSGETIEDRTFSLSCAAIQDSAGATVSAICLFTDRTDAMRRPDSVQKEHDALYALLTQAPGFIAFLEGPEHRYTYANAAYLQLVARTDLVGQRVIDAFPEVIAQGFVDILDRVFRSGEPFAAKGVFVTFNTADGASKQAFIDLNYYAIRNPAGTITGIFVAGEDTTEHHRAQQRVGVLQNELIHSSRINAMGMMVSTIAHEINQPLTAIHNFMTVARMVLEQGEHDPRATEALEGAADAALRAGDVIRNIKAMTARRDVSRRPVVLRETLREAVALASLGLRNVHVAYDLQGAPTVQGDKVLIQQILFNLVRNALEAAAGQDVTVTIATADQGPLVEICVSDTGPGIEPEQLPLLFEAFQTSKVDGTGIGLSICQAIVEAHGGTISARNGSESGAVLCFTLPRSA